MGDCRRSLRRTRVGDVGCLFVRLVEDPFQRWERKQEAQADERKSQNLPSYRMEEAKKAKEAS